jgi:hypothetical protein
VVARLIAILNRTDPDLFGQLTSALETLPAESFTVERLEQLLYSVRSLNVQAYNQVERELSTELRNFVEYETDYQYQLFRSAIPAQVIAQVDVATVAVEQVYAAAMARPFQGRLLKEWAQSIEADRMTRIRDAVRMGYVENQTTSQIVQRIRGTRAQGYSDGIIEIDRRHAEAVVRTALSHTAGFTRDRFMKANGDLIKAVVWTATLDSRTSEGCRLRDGLEYTADDAHKPIGHAVPWLGGPGALHWNCRSISVPVTKSWKELGGVDIGEFSASTRASMDGEVPEETTYAEWIKQQSAARQDEILGPTRGKLMRDGGLTLDRYYSDKGKYWTLDELRQRDAAAFERAGL